MSAVLPPLLLRGGCLVELKRIPDASVDAVVTDPPYGIRFMGKAWDGSDISTKVAERRAGAPMPDNGRNGSTGGYRSAAAEAGKYNLSLESNRHFQEWCEAWARECLRILKPGGHLLASGSPRTWHRLAAGIEDAGFEIRDSIAWLYGSGFPKSMDVSKAIDKAAGAAREVIGKATNGVKGMDAMNLAQGKRGKMYHEEATYDVTAPATDAAREWNGWGTALKPAFEPIVVARKPLIGTVAANVLEHGTGALNIDATRIHTEDALVRPSIERRDNAVLGKGLGAGRQDEPVGRWPANVAFDESQAAALDEQSGVSKGRPAKSTMRGEGSGSGIPSQSGVPFVGGNATTGYEDEGGASRFFYVAKAPKSERPVVDGVAHPTVKPLTLMRWLLRLVTPPGGVIVDPFAGSGTTLEAAYLEGFESIGVEMTPEYWPLIEERIARVAGVQR